MLTEIDQELLKKVEGGFTTVGEAYETVHLRAALGDAMQLATEVNRYLDITAPWLIVKTDKQAAARAVYTAINAINMIKIMLAPVIPFTSQKLHEFLGFEGQLFGTQSVQAIKDDLGEHHALQYHPEGSVGKWENVVVKPGQKLVQPLPLFRKLEPKIIDEERARLGKS